MSSSSPSCRSADDNDEHAANEEERLALALCIVKHRRAAAHEAAEEVQRWKQKAAALEQEVVRIRPCEAIMQLLLKKQQQLTKATDAPEGSTADGRKTDAMECSGGTFNSDHAHERTAGDRTAEYNIIDGEMGAEEQDELMLSDELLAGADEVVDADNAGKGLDQMDLFMLLEALPKLPIDQETSLTPHHYVDSLSDDDSECLRLSSAAVSSDALYDTLLQNVRIIHTWRCLHDGMVQEFDQHTNLAAPAAALQEIVEALIQLPSNVLADMRFHPYLLCTFRMLSDNWNGQSEDASHHHSAHRLIACLLEQLLQDPSEVSSALLGEVLKDVAGISHHLTGLVLISAEEALTGVVATLSHPTTLRSLRDPRIHSEMHAAIRGDEVTKSRTSPHPRVPCPLEEAILQYHHSFNLFELVDHLLDHLALQVRRQSRASSDLSTTLELVNIVNHMHFDLQCAVDMFDSNFHQLVMYTTRLSAKLTTLHHRVCNMSV